MYICKIPCVKLQPWTKIRIYIALMRHVTRTSGVPCPAEMSSSVNCRTTQKPAQRLVRSPPFLPGLMTLYVLKPVHTGQRKKELIIGRKKMELHSTAITIS